MIDDRQLSAFLHPRYDAAPRTAPALAEWMKSAAEAYGEASRAALVQTYGWARLHARVEIDIARRELVVRGDTMLRSTARKFARGLRRIAGTRYRVAVSFTTAEERGSWHALLEPVMRIWRDAAATTPATELLRADGPVQLLARTPSGTLVRCADGTAGWTQDPLGAAVAMPSAMAKPSTIDGSRGGRWSAAARSFVGVPYRLGGTTREGMDCSGFTQRLYRDVLGLAIPRHSRDQFNVGRAAARLPGEGRAEARPTLRAEGQLAFIKDGPSPLHVGVLLRNARGEWSVVHASSSRGLVVEDPYEEYVQRGGELVA